MGGVRGLLGDDLVDAGFGQRDAEHLRLAQHRLVRGIERVGRRGIGCEDDAGAVEIVLGVLRADRQRIGGRGRRRDRRLCPRRGLGHGGLLRRLLSACNA